MGVLYVAEHLAAPSHLWMRRMLDGLGADVAMLADTHDPGSEYRRRYPLIRLDENRGSWRNRIRRRLDNLLRSPTDDSGTKRLRRAAASPRVTRVLVHFLTTAVRHADAWQNADKPVFVHCHGYDVTWDLRHHAGSIGLPAHPADYVRRVRELPPHVRFIANSCVTRDRLCEIGVADTRIDVKPLGVEIPPEPPVRDASERDCRILFLGRLIDCKGPDLLLQAFERACAAGLAGHLTIAGDGPLRVTLELLRARSPVRERIELLGAIDAETGARLRRATDIFSGHNCRGPLTRQEEAFGVGYVEAMAAGLPIVSTRNGSLPEILADSGAGILVEPGDVEAHAAALLRLAHDPNQRVAMGRAGWRRAHDCYSLAEEIRRLRTILGLESKTVEPIRPCRLTNESAADGAREEEIHAVC